MVPILDGRMGKTVTCSIFRINTGVKRVLFFAAMSEASAPSDTVHSAPHVLVERDGHVAIVTMNRPAARNAMGLELLVRLADAWDAIDADPEVRGYQTNARLNYHADSSDIVALLCLKPAKSGGLSRIASYVGNVQPVATIHGVKVLADHAQREILLLLRSQDVAQSLHVVIGIFSVARSRALWLDEPFTLKEADLGFLDVRVGELLAQLR